jgi:hypothetical protein
VGLQVCAMTGFYSFMKQARLWQLQHGRTREELDEVQQPRTTPDTGTAGRHAA